MNRNIFSLTLALAVTLGLLSSCKQDQPNKDVDVDLEAFYTSITETHQMQSGMEPIPDDMIPNVYPGLEDIATDQRVIHVSMLTMSSQEIALVKVTNEGDIEAVKDMFQTRIDQQAEGGAWYPAAIETWKNNARVVVNGHYVMMVVHEDAADIEAEFNALFQ